ISGGCLEGDALKKALSAIHQQENKLVTYDTTDEDDAKFGVQLGCNGIVHILFEPINNIREINPISILESLQSKREDAVVVTLFSLQGKNQIGTVMIYRSADVIDDVPAAIRSEVLNDVEEVFEGKLSSFKVYQHGEQIDALIEFISPPIALIIAGAGNDAQPLADIAYMLGWAVTVVDGRQTHATQQRFANAQKVLIAKPAQLIPQVEIDGQTAIVLMTHNYNYDMELLGMLIATNAPYIGTLGPKKKLIRMLDELQMNTEENQMRVHGPVGLDIGAETAEEIAISIIAEIKSVFAGAKGKSLKEKTGAIHSYTEKSL
ncbi:MAG: XdhC/CoxI family protein, partial [Chitinophagaceae bacterium]